MQFGLRYGIANTQGQISMHDAHAILERARTHGMRILDTAIAYGESETRLGAIGVQTWSIVTKLPRCDGAVIDVGRWVGEAVAGSLRRLGVQQLYGLLLHAPSDLLGDRGSALYDAMVEARNTGGVAKIGLSIYDPLELGPLVDRYSFDLVQAPFNVVDRRLLESGWLDRLHSAGVEVHTRSAFLQGLLLMQPAERPPAFAKWQSVWNAWSSWLDDTGLTALQACVRYPLSMSAVDRVVVGVDSPRQLDEIVRASEGALPELPDTFRSDDPDLVNPARWTT